MDPYGSVYILCIYKLQLLPFHIVDAPVETVLESNTTNNTIARPGAISFNCTTDSHPRPLSYELFKDNALVDSNTDGTFVISSESLPYQVTFSCVPNNLLGPGHEAELDVIVYGKEYD